MRFRPLSLFCECGRAPSRIKRVGLTPSHELVIHWSCLGCKRNVYAVKQLADCWRECPNTEELLEAPEASSEHLREADAKFLGRLKVKFPDELEP
jgi:hypothetical protein